MVLDEDHYQLDAFGDGGDQFGVHHQVGAVPPHHDNHIPVRAACCGFCQRCALHAQTAGDLVTHAEYAYSTW